MRSISPLAALLLAVGLVAFALGVSAPQARAQMGFTAQQLHNSHVSHPRDWVRIQEGTTYVVPSGKILVVTALGSLNGAWATLPHFFIDSDLALMSSSDINDGNGTNIKAVPIGLTASALQTVQVYDYGAGDLAYVWGYLVDA